MKKRKYLTEDEINKLISNIEKGMDSARNRCMLYMAYIHGLRVSELTGLLMSDIDSTFSKIHIRRLKNGMSVQHPLLSEELQLLKIWLVAREKYHNENSPWLFISRKGGRISRQRIYTLIRQSGIKAHLSLLVHPHMLRHACGFSLAERGIDTRLIQDYLGHRNIRHTVVYTASNSQRFYGIWEGG